jgi:hypothetical protein
MRGADHRRLGLADRELRDVADEAAGGEAQRCARGAQLDELAANQSAHAGALESSSLVRRRKISSSDAASTASSCTGTPVENARSPISSVLYA